MKPSVFSRPGSFITLWWKFLGFSAMFLGLFHVMVALFQYVLGYMPFAPYERWFGLFLIIVTVISLPISALISSDFRQKCKILLKQLCSYEQIFLLFLFLWFAAGCFVLQQKEGLPYLKAADWLLFDTGISVLILFPLARFLDREKARSLINFILHFVLISYSLFTAWASCFIWSFSCFPTPAQLSSVGSFSLFAPHSAFPGIVSEKIKSLLLSITFSSAWLLPPSAVFYSGIFVHANACL